MEPTCRKPDCGSILNRPTSPSRKSSPPALVHVRRERFVVPAGASPVPAKVVPAALIHRSSCRRLLAVIGDRSSLVRTPLRNFSMRICRIVAVTTVYKHPRRIRWSSTDGTKIGRVEKWRGSLDGAYPAGTTFAGTGLAPAGTTNLSRRTWTSASCRRKLPRCRRCSKS